jgi:nucleoside-diphosphate-sugar epimerase
MEVKMKKILVTGGTVFVSRYIAEHYVAKGYDVSVLNRNTKPQSAGVKLIQADRHNIGDVLRDHHFDVVIDTAYTSEDVLALLDALGSYDDYILISSSAVYPEYAPQPFNEESKLGINKYWGKYGTDKIEAEKALMARNPNAYVLRPPYLYGPMNNVYREAFVFDCALADRKFYIPQKGEMKLQFFHVDDLCRFIDILLEKKPSQHIFNVGNKEAVSIREWVELCYHVAEKTPEFVNVQSDIEQRNYFSFYNYEYYLDVSKQDVLMPDTKPLCDGLKESFEWYKGNSDQVSRKPFLDYIDCNLI